MNSGRALESSGVLDVMLAGLELNGVELLSCAHG